MKRKIFTILLCGILIIGITGCGKDNSSNRVKGDNVKKESIDYTRYTDNFSAKIISANFYNYSIEDINNDKVPELLGKNGGDSNAEFKMYRLDNDELKEVTNDSTKTGFNNIKNLSKYLDKNNEVFYLITEFDSNYQSGGLKVDLAYIKGNTYVEYNKLMGLDLDTIQNSSVSKKTLDLKTGKITEKQYDFTVDTNVPTIEAALVTPEYSQEIAEFRVNLKLVEEVKFYENEYSEWNHDDSMIKTNVKVLLETFNENKSDNNSNSNKNSKLKIDARYSVVDEKKRIAYQLDLYSDGTIYFSYVPATSATDSEYYNGTYEIKGNKLILNLIPAKDEKTSVFMDQGNPKTFTIVSKTELKDKDGNLYKYNTDYKKNQLPN